MNEIEKQAKYCKQYSMIYFVISVIAIIMYLMQGTLLYLNIVAAILFLLCFIGSGKQEKYGPICGIIASIMLILTFNILEIIFAIFLLVNCVNLLKLL